MLKDGANLRPCVPSGPHYSNRAKMLFAIQLPSFSSPITRSSPKGTGQCHSPTIDIQARRNFQRLFSSTHTEFMTSSQKASRCPLRPLAMTMSSRRSQPETATVPRRSGAYASGSRPFSAARMRPERRTQRVGSSPRAAVGRTSTPSSASSSHSASRSPRPAQCREWWTQARQPVVFWHSEKHARAVSRERERG